MSNMCTYCTSTWEETDLEQLQYDLCECSTKSQAPTLSVSSSSQVPLVAAENFRLGSGEKKKIRSQLYWGLILTVSIATSLAHFHAVLLMRTDPPTMMTNPKIMA